MRKTNPEFVGVSPAIVDRQAYGDFISAQVKVKNKKQKNNNNI